MTEIQSKISPEVADTILSHVGNKAYFARLSEISIISNAMMLMSFTQTQDHDMAEICRGLKYTALASLAYAGDTRGLLEKKVLSEPHMRSFFSSYLAQEIIKAAVDCTTHREESFSSHVKFHLEHDA